MVKPGVKKRRSKVFHAPGVRGRATGVEVKKNVRRGQEGLAEVNDFFESEPEEDLRRSFIDSPRNDDDESDLEDQPRESAEQLNLSQDNGHEQVATPKRLTFSKDVAVQEFDGEKEPAELEPSNKRKSIIPLNTPDVKDNTSNGANSLRKQVLSAPRLIHSDSVVNSTPVANTQSSIPTPLLSAVAGSPKSILKSTSRVTRATPLTQSQSEGSPKFFSPPQARSPPAAPLFTPLLRGSAASRRSSLHNSSLINTTGVGVATLSQSLMKPSMEPSVLEPSVEPSTLSEAAEIPEISVNNDVGGDDNDVSNGESPENKDVARKVAAIRAKRRSMATVVARGPLVSDESMLEDREEGIRRGKRTRIAPVEYWKNEKVIYEPESNGWLKVKDVFKPPALPEKAIVKNKSSKSRSGPNKKPTKVNLSPIVEEQEDDTDLEQDNVFDPTIAVIDWTDENRPLTAITMAKTRSSLDMKTSGEGLHVAKYFQLRDEQWSNGIVELEPNVKKPLQATKSNFLVFYIVSGKVEVKLADSTLLMSTGTSFFIPPWNNYDMTNVGTKKASLHFTQVKVGADVPR